MALSVDRRDKIIAAVAHLRESNSALFQELQQACSNPDYRFNGKATVQKLLKWDLITGYKEHREGGYTVTIGADRKTLILGKPQ